MTREFPELRAFFGGYLHEDFVREHSSAAAALKAFEADASATELKRFRAEAKQLLGLVEDEGFDAAKARLAGLGAKWAPRSRAALVRWLNAATGGS